MRLLSRIGRRFLSLVRKERLDEELSEELRFHVERQIGENIAAGMTPEDARREALRELGGVEQIAEECRDMRRTQWFETLLQDTRFGIRTFRRQPAFTFCVLAILAFGVLVDPAQKIAERLDATVVNMRFVKPLDEDLIISVAARHRAIITIEENATLGGAGSAVAELLASEGLQVPMLQIGIPDRFIEHGSRETCLAAAGLDLAGLTASVERWWAMQAQDRMRSAGGG